MIPLDIISDPICPWCYIGKARLDAAIAEHGSNPFNITWRPFLLNPTMPPEGMERQAYLNWKFGGPEAAARIYGAIEKTADDTGLPVNFSAITRAPNTIDAHRLILWAAASGNQSALTGALFDGYFQDGADIGDPEVLADIAEASGMDRDVVERLLEGDVDRETVLASDKAAREMGVNGVPMFIIANQFVLTGAQDAETWLRLIRELDAVWSEMSSDTRGALH